jgi:3-oxoacyl-[acyl-carrier-protein] synthase I
MSIGISAMGMATSVGLDAATACASIRAGIQRPQLLHHYAVLDHEEQDTKPLVARAIVGLTDGFVGVARWLRLAGVACRDAAHDASLRGAVEGEFWSRTAVCMILSEPDARRYADDEPSAGDLTKSLLDPLLDEMGWPVPPRHRVLIRAGHAGLAQAVQSAATKMSTGRLDRVFMLAADSYVDSETLDWLSEDDRLKLDDQPFGLIPGEAAACFLLENEHATRQRGGILTARLVGANFAPTQGHFRSETPMLGMSLSHSVEQTLRESDVSSFDGLIVADLNGEPWRSHELGAAQVRLGGQLAPTCRWHFPADSLGETGAASAAAGVCFAAMALSRGYAGSGNAAVLSSAESGSAGCVLLESATPPLPA